METNNAIAEKKAPNDESMAEIARLRDEVFYHEVEKRIHESFDKKFNSDQLIKESLEKRSELDKIVDKSLDKN